MFESFQTFFAFIAKMIVLTYLVIEYDVTKTFL